MKRVLKWFAIIVGGLLLVLLAGVLFITSSTNRRLNTEYDFDVAALTIPTDAAALARGEHLVETLCVGCHGDDLGGTILIEDPALAIVAASNLTRGQGGIGGQYGDEDWVRAIRHGSNSEGQALFIMPAADCYFLSDENLAAVIAYVKSVPAVDQEWPEREIGTLGKILIGVGAFGDVLNVETIPHEAARPAAVPAGTNAAYGEYLVNISSCRSCHGTNLAGGQDGEPGAPPAHNLTPGGELAGWTEAEFQTVLRTGQTPDGRQLSEFMPWQTLGNYSDEELTAIWLYLNELPALPTNE